MKRVKKPSKKILAAIVAGAIAAVILITALGLEIAFICADKIVCITPDYDKIEISALLDKQTLSDDDYQLLYRQTGLTKIGVNRALERGATGKQRILDIQTDYFKERKVKNDKFAPFVCTDRLEGKSHMQNIYLEKGDIIVTSSTHISGVRIGHSGLVTNAASGTVLQAMAYGQPTFEGSIRGFTSRVNFMILRPKVDANTRSDVADYALETFKGVAYDGLLGLFLTNDRTDRTQCTHMIWKSFYDFGIDLNSGGGLLITPRDIANSPHVELVQVFGFDPDKLWK